MKWSKSIALGCAVVVCAGVAAAQPTAPAPAPAAPSGGGDVNLSPKRLVLSGRNRSAEVVLFNRGTGRAVYRIELKDMVMTPGGSLVPVENADPALKTKLRPADGLIRFSPRRVELAPGESQVIRVLAHLPEGGSGAPELRSHLLVSLVPSAEAGLDITEAVGAKPGQLKLQLIPVFGISIPIFIRSSTTPAAAEWSNVSVKRDGAGWLLKADLIRKSDHSIYGDVEARCGTGEKSVLLGQLRGAGVYSEIDSRHVELQLKLPDGQSVSAGPCALTFKDDEQAQGAILARSELQLP